MDIKVVEQLLGMAGVFGSNEINLFENTQGPQSYIFKVADGSGDHIERTDGSEIRLHHRKLLEVKKRRVRKKNTL